MAADTPALAESIVLYPSFARAVLLILYFSKEFFRKDPETIIFIKHIINIFLEYPPQTSIMVGAGENSSCDQVISRLFRPFVIGCIVV
jgi:hypothetical protein